MPSASHRFLTFLLALFACIVFSLSGLLYYLHDEENYSRIEDRLYLGGDVAVPPRGTRAVINLCEKEDLYPCEFYLWEPIRDNEPAPDLDWLRRMVDILDARQREGMTTYVHCRNGVSRSGMLVIAYEMHRHHWTREEALAFVRERRPIVRPNPAFMERLREWERVIEEEAVTPSSSMSAR